MDPVDVTDHPAFWVILLVLGVPGAYATLLTLLRNDRGKS